MKKLVFTHGDFSKNHPGDWTPYTFLQMAIAAQERFDEWFKNEIESGPMVYGVDNGNKVFSITQSAFDTHTARLIDIQKIKKECVKHEPESDYINNRRVWKEKCKHCGADLIAEWKVKS